MATEKTLRNVRAHVRNRTSSQPETGRVELYGVATWLKNGQLVSTVLSPTQARHLAVELLVAVERAESGSNEIVP